MDDEPVELGYASAADASGAARAACRNRGQVTAIEDVLWEDERSRAARRRSCRPTCLACAGSSARIRSSSRTPATRSTQASPSTRFAFASLCEQRQFAQALALWRGDALSDVPALVADARQLDELRVSAIEERIADELERGAGPALVPELEALVADHPTRERLLGQLVLALYRSGQASRRARCLPERPGGVRRGLGLEPGPALRELELQILRHDPSLLPAPGARSSRSARRHDDGELSSRRPSSRSRPPRRSGSPRSRQAMRRLSFRSAPTRCSSSTRRPTRSSAAFRSRGTPQPSSRRATHSGSQANASAPCRGSISAPML